MPKANESSCSIHLSIVINQVPCVEPAYDAKVKPMVHFPTQVRWRDFFGVLRHLGYVQQKGKAGSKRFFVNPERIPNSVSLREPHSGENLNKAVLRLYLQKLQLSGDEFLRLLEKH